MRRSLRVATSAAVASLLALSACSASDDGSARTPTVTGAPATFDLGDQASGPASPIAYGFEVPRGAIQLGPLVRYRSARLVAAYQPELDAALAQREAEQELKRREALAEGQTLAPTTPTPTPTNVPGDDTFDLLDEQPTPDVAISTMRVTGSPTTVLRTLLAQINAVIPDAGIDTDDISPYCAARDNRVIGCRVNVTGPTTDARPINVQISLDPGDVRTRTGYPASAERPVLLMKVAFVGDPRLGQATRPKTVDVPSSVDGADRSGLIWPKMDESATLDKAVVGSWTVPTTGQLLLNGSRPPCAAIFAPNVAQATALASDFASSYGKPRRDVVEDLNEITTTFMTRTDRGTALGAFVLTASGSYTMTYFWPSEREWTKVLPGLPEPPPTPAPSPVPSPSVSQGSASATPTPSAATSSSR